MKQPILKWIHIVLLIILIQLVRSPGASAQDLPGFIPNIQTAPTGTLVLGMDNTNQLDGGGKFNLKVYGLAVRLLTKGYNLKWVIRTGKLKDQIDFSVAAEKLYPSFVASSIKNFKAGPIIIFPSDTNGIHQVINAYNNLFAASAKVQVYRLTASASVDIRYNLIRVPRIAVLSDGANQGIHTAFLTAAAIPAQNYSVFNATSLNTDCFTFASEPHLSGVAGAPYLSAVRNYVLNGGNFLAQCAAIPTYENLDFGRYHSSTGILVTNVNFNATVSYPNADMSFSQTEGSLRPSGPGTVSNWQFNAGGIAQNNHYSVMGNTLNPNHIAASVSKLIGSEGGLVFYLPNHNYNATGSVDQINGIRMYLNAMLTPSGLACNWSVWLLPAKIETFNAVSVDNIKNLIEWKSYEELKDTWYIVEHSRDGIRFTSLKKIDAGSNSGRYSYTHESPAPGKNYYRIRIENTAGHISYTPTKAVFNNQKSAIILNSPARNSFSVSIPNNSPAMQSIILTDMNGKTVMHINSIQSTNVSVQVSHLSNGTYIVLLLMKNGDIIRDKIIVAH